MRCSLRYHKYYLILECDFIFLCVIYVSWWKRRVTWRNPASLGGIDCRGIYTVTFAGSFSVWSLETGRVSKFERCLEKMDNLLHKNKDVRIYPKSFDEDTEKPTCANYL